MNAFAKPLQFKLTHLQRHTTMALLLSLAASVLPAQAADITVEILPLPSTEGSVMVSLFDRPADFPGAGIYSQQIAASRQVAGQPLLLVFTQLPPGRYAIAAFQDKVGNAKLSTNLMGIPSGPVGFSNNAKASFGPPSFDSAAPEQLHSVQAAIGDSALYGVLTGLLNAKALRLLKLPPHQNRACHCRRRSAVEDPDVG